MELIGNDWNLFVAGVLWLAFTLIIVIYFSLNTLPGILYAMSQKDDRVLEPVAEAPLVLMWSATQDDYRYWWYVSGDCRVAENFEEFVDNVAGTPVDEEQWNKYCSQ